MTKTALDYIIDTLLATVFLGLAFLGVLLGFFIPKGQEAPGYQKILWGLHRHAWGDIHLYFSLAFVALILIHLILHWDWLKNASRRHLPRSVAAWVLVVLVAAAGLVYGGARLMPPKAYWGAGERQSLREAPGRGQRRDQRAPTTAPPETGEQSPGQQRRYRGGRGG